MIDAYHFYPNTHTKRNTVRIAVNLASGGALAPGIMIISNGTNTYRPVDEVKCGWQSIKPRCHYYSRSGLAHMAGAYMAAVAAHLHITISEYQAHTYIQAVFLCL